MPFYLVQAGSSLQRISSTGALTTLALPSGVTIDSTVRGRFAMLGRRIVFVRAPSRNLVIDPDDDTAQLMALLPPSQQPTLAAGTGTGLTGSYRVRVHFKKKDADGNVLQRSPSSAASVAVSLTNQTLAVSNIAISPDADVNCRGLERTTAGGSIYYDWLDIDDNVTTAIDEGLADASLDQLPASATLGLPSGSAYGSPRPKLIESWKNRLWMVDDDDPDYVRYSEEEQVYAWPADNLIRIPPVGLDAEGCTAFLPRRDELGVGKRDRLAKIQLNGTEFGVVQVIEGAGPVSAESVVIVRDIARFLGEDNVYEYGPGGVRPIGDDVKPWFTEDDTFTRSAFGDAVGWWDPILDTYNLLFPTDELWIELYLSGPYAGKWLGPHKTDAFTVSFGALLEDANDLALPALAGTDGFVYTCHGADKHDGAATAIDFDIDLAAIHADTPDIIKYLGHLSLLTRIESGGTLSVTPTVGDLTAGVTQLPMAFDLTKGRERGRRIGLGRSVALNLRNANVDEPVTVRGFELPYHEVGRR